MSSLRQKLVANGGRQSWDEMLAELQEYKEKNGDCLVRRSYGKLGQWVSDQRKRGKGGTKGRLCSEQIRKLDDLGFIWEVHKIDAWDGMFSQLEEYSRKHGNCLVTAASTKLGRWVRVQRQRRQEPLRYGELSKAQIRRLDSIGFQWKLQDAWDEMFEQLKDYKRKNGTCAVPQNMDKLGRWVTLQRICRDAPYRHHKRLTPRQVRKLNSIGFIWDGVTHLCLKNWDEMFNKLAEYAKKHGDCYVPTTEGSQLGNWVAMQRQRKNKPHANGSTPLTANQIERLESIGFDFSPPRGAAALNINRKKSR